jgi:hypothetical protein
MATSTVLHFPRITPQASRDYAQTLAAKARDLRKLADEHDADAAECRRLAGEMMREARTFLNASEGIFHGLEPAARPLPWRYLARL